MYLRDLIQRHVRAVVFDVDRSSMCTEARPVRVEAIALRKSSTALSMRVLS